MNFNPHADEILAAAASPLPAGHQRILGNARRKNAARSPVCRRPSPADCRRCARGAHLRGPLRRPPRTGSSVPLRLQRIPPRKGPRASILSRGGGTSRCRPRRKRAPSLRNRPLGLGNGSPTRWWRPCTVLRTLRRIWTRRCRARGTPHCRHARSRECPAFEDEATGSCCPYAARASRRPQARSHLRRHLLMARGEIYFPRVELFLSGELRSDVT